MQSEEFKTRDIDTKRTACVLTDDKAIFDNFLVYLQFDRDEVVKSTYDYEIGLVSGYLIGRLDGITVTVNFKL